MVQIITEITYKCPAKCHFCPLREMRRKDTMSLENFTKALDLFSEFFSSTENAVVISGGEPSTVQNLEEYVRTARDLNYTVTIVTNAFNPNRIILAKPDAIEISIDYFGKKHDRIRGIDGLFDSALWLVINALRNDIVPIIRSTAMCDNIGDIILLKRLAESKFDDIPVIAMPIRGHPRLEPSPEQIKELEKAGVIVSNNCPAGISSFVITPNMEILACIFYRKKLGQLIEFTTEELKEALENGRKIPRFPCNKKGSSMTLQLLSFR